MSALAIKDFHEALDINKDFQRAKDGIQKAQKLQKQAERRDYYKILGVGRRASKQEVTKAYRLVQCADRPIIFLLCLPYSD